MIQISRFLKHSRRTFANIASSSAYLFDEFGRPEDVLVYRTLFFNFKYRKLDIDIPPIKGHEILCKVVAAPMKFTDLGAIEGNSTFFSLPAVAGIEGVGLVSSVGDKVKDFKEGDKVIFTKSTGTWCTLATVYDSDICKLPDNAIPIECATIMSSHAYAYRILHDFGNLKPGDTVIQSGPQTPVGFSIIQQAKEMNLNLINVFKPGKHGEYYTQKLTELNANPIGTSVEEITKALDSKKAKLVVDAIGGTISTKLVDCLEESGDFVSYHSLYSNPLVIPSPSLIVHNVSISGFSIKEWFDRSTKAEVQKMVNDISKMITDGKLKSFIKEVPFTDCEAVLNHVQAFDWPETVVMSM